MATREEGPLWGLLTSVPKLPRPGLQPDFAHVADGHRLSRTEPGEIKDYLHFHEPVMLALGDGAVRPTDKMAHLGHNQLTAGRASKPTCPPGQQPLVTGAESGPRFPRP